MYCLPAFFPCILWYVNYKHFPSSLPTPMFSSFAMWLWGPFCQEVSSVPPPPFFCVCVCKGWSPDFIWKIKYGKNASSEPCTLPLYPRTLIHYESNPRLAWGSMKEHLESRWSFQLRPSYISQLPTDQLIKDAQANLAEVNLDENRPGEPA